LSTVASMEHVVVWDSEAVREFEELKNVKERKSVHIAVSFLAQTTTLPMPHAKKLKDEPGLFELRPRSGKSYVRPIYRQTKGGFAILAVSIKPDKADFPKALENARARFAHHDD